MMGRARSPGRSDVARLHGASPTSSLSPSVRGSSLMRAGGFRVFEGMHDRATFQALLADALNKMSVATATDNAQDDGEEVRGGRPARRFLTAPAGSTQAAAYAAPDLLTFLSGLAGTRLEPTGDAGTYSYYVRPGDFLALHRDIETCDLAVITCLRDTLDSRRTDGALCLYPERSHEPMSRIRATPARGVVAIRLGPGQTLAMLGGVVPHALLPVAPGQERIVSIVCYRIEGRRGAGTHVAPPPPH